MGRAHLLLSGVAVGVKDAQRILDQNRVDLALGLQRDEVVSPPAATHKHICEQVQPSTTSVCRRLTDDPQLLQSTTGCSPEQVGAHGHHVVLLCCSPTLADWLRCCVARIAAARLVLLARSGPLARAAIA